VVGCGGMWWDVVGGCVVVCVGGGRHMVMKPAGIIYFSQSERTGCGVAYGSLHMDRTNCPVTVLLY